MTKITVFAYHTIGVDCLEILYQANLEIGLIVTHLDNHQELIWFKSVRQWALAHHIPVITPSWPFSPATEHLIRASQPDLIFSFYYRHLIPEPILHIAPLGAYNLHGSLLPAFRGRVPINWAIIEGADKTGATLHVMTAKADQGDIIIQQEIPIGPNDTAHMVFERLTTIAPKMLAQILPSLCQGSAPRTAQNLSLGRYYGARKPEDGCIQWSQTAQQIHNLVRAVAPPYPGAFTKIQGKITRVLSTRLESHPDAVAYTEGGDGKPLYILEMEYGGELLTKKQFKQLFPMGIIPEIQ